MKEKDLTSEMLIAAGTDLNKVLEPNPPIVVALDGAPFKGIALVNAKKKFVGQLRGDLAEAAGLIAPTDVLAPATVDVLEALGVEGIREKLLTSEKGSASKKGVKSVKKEADKEETEKPAKKKEGGKVGLNDWGHLVGSQGDQIDNMIKKVLAEKKEIDVDDLVRRTGLSKGRVNAHLSHLRRVKKIK